MRVILSFILVIVFFAALALCAGEVRIVSSPPGTERDRQGGVTVLDTSAAQPEEETATLRFRRFFSRAITPVRRSFTRRFERASGFSRHVYTRASRGVSRAARSVSRATRSSARAARRVARRSARAARRETRRAARGMKRVSRNLRKYEKIALRANKVAKTRGRTGRLFKRLLKRADKRFKKARKEFNRFTKSGYKKTPEAMDKEIALFGSTSLPGGKCLSSCHWFTLPGVVWTNFDPIEKHQICGNCAVRLQHVVKY